MNRTSHPTKPFGRLLLLTFITIFLLAGCLPMDGDQDAKSSGHAPIASPTTANPNVVGNEPYYPADFRDLLIPGELEWRRDKSVSISTDSFTGGILNFTGRVEVNSLTEFFINGMKKDGWSLIGSIKSDNVLLAFIKDKASCLIKIDEGGAIGKTEVNIYLTHKNN